MLLKTEGKISEIKATSEYFGSIIIRKRIRGLIQPVVFEIKGEPFRDCVKHKYFKEGDKVRIWFVPSCRKHNDRYYTNLIVEKMEIIESNPLNLFTEYGMVDIETGETLE